MSKKVKLTQVCKYYAPFCGGIEAVAKQISDILAGEDFDVNVLAVSHVNGKTTNEEIDKAKVTRCKKDFIFKANPISLDFIRELSKVDTDILHYQHPFIFAAIAHFIARPKYKKLTMTFCCDVVKQKYIMIIFNPIYEKFISLVDKIHVLAPNMIQSSKTLAKFKDKAEIIPNCISLNDYDVVDQSQVALLKEECKNKKILLFVGRLIYYKGISIIIEAMKQVSDDAVVFVVGTGDLEESLKQKVKEENLEKKVIFKGFVPDEDLKAYYHACDIFLFPSITKAEAYGISQLEAMACGKPVINTNLDTGVNFVSIGGETGITIEPENVYQLAEAINLLIKDEELRLKLSLNARKRIEELFSLEKIKDSYRKFYLETLNTTEK